MKAIFKEQKVLLTIYITSVLFIISCSTPCDNRLDKVQINYTLISGETIKETLNIPHRSEIYLTQSMGLYYTRGCSDSFKLKHDDDCASKYHAHENFKNNQVSHSECGNRISLGVIRYNVTSRHLLK